MAANTPLSVRLDPGVRQILKEAAAAQGVPLRTYLRLIASDHARALRRQRIRAESKAVGAYVRSSREGQAFYDEVGTPSAEI
ncbi:MAG: hypothetical protein GIX02_12365 [Candidatus Eremiobacteraeota bacterium]|nr:hypothetical protein [Candidatus Eremiobacteraeota bacterium]